MLLMKLNCLLCAEINSLFSHGSLMLKPELRDEFFSVVEIHVKMCPNAVCLRGKDQSTEDLCVFVYVPSRLKKRLVSCICMVVRLDLCSIQCFYKHSPLFSLERMFGQVQSLDGFLLCRSIADTPALSKCKPDINLPTHHPPQFFSHSSTLTPTPPLTF